LPPQSILEELDCQRDLGMVCAVELLDLHDEFGDGFQDRDAILYRKSLTLRVIEPRDKYHRWGGGSI
jgi:hypothetical protein